MDDRELLEKAARAAGVELSEQGTTTKEGHTWRWSPLEDDSDAFRLMVALGISPEFDGYAEMATQDELSKTRRAIVRAAAAMADT